MENNKGVSYMSESDKTSRYLSVAELEEALSSMVGMNNLSRAFNMQKSAGGSSIGLNICGIELYLLLKARCAKSEKNEIIKIIAEIVALNNISRRHGLISLSHTVKELSCDFIKVGIQMVLDAFSPEIVKETMLKTLYTGNFKGVELLKRLIIIEGVLSIQCGDSNYNIKTKLFAFLGEKSLLEITQESPEIDKLLDKYNPFRAESMQIDKVIKHASGPGNFNFVKCEFEKFLKSDFIIYNLLSIFLLKNNEVFTPKIKVLNENTLDAIDRTLL